VGVDFIEVLAKDVNSGLRVLNNVIKCEVWTECSECVKVEDSKLATARGRAMFVAHTRAKVGNRAICLKCLEGPCRNFCFHNPNPIDAGWDRDR